MPTGCSRCPPARRERATVAFYLYTGARRSSFGGLPSRTQPLYDHRDPPHDILGHHDPVVDALPGVDGVNHLRQTQAEAGDADPLDPSCQPVRPLVGVERRGNPGEVDPGPDHGKHREGEPADPRRVVALGGPVGKLVCRRTQA
jgi:hypothetical protein